MTPKLFILLVVAILIAISSILQLLLGFIKWEYATPIAIASMLLSLMTILGIDSYVKSRVKE
jgi:hypothetical protein